MNGSVPYRILVVDDSQHLARNIAQLFANAGHRTRSAYSAAEARALLEAEACELALVDIRLQGDSGVELAGFIKHSCPDAEVILMTGEASLDSAIAAVHGDAYAYVQKPFDPAELLALGERALAQVKLRYERALLQSRLERSEALYRGVVDAVDSFIIGLGHDGQIGVWNRSAAESTGWTSTDMLGKPFGALLASDRSRAQLADALERVLAGEEVSGLELPVATAQGAQRVVRWTLSRLGEDEAETPLVLAVGVDMTDRIELERRAAEAEAMAALGNLTAGLAHEIRNPLNAAVLQLELLERTAQRLDDAALKQRITSRVAIVHEEIDRLSRLLNDFLNLARPRALELAEVDIAELAAEVAQLEEPAAKAAGLEIGVRTEPGALIARGNAALLKQVLVNLVVNSIDAMRPRGWGRIEIGCHAKGDTRLELSVEDDGPGIPKEVGERLFVPFVTTKAAGTGLGLTIVKRIADRHGGTVHVASGATRGTQVRIGLPRGAKPTDC